MITQYENVFFAVVMIGLIVIFSLAFLLLAGWLVIMAVDFVKNHFKRVRDNNA